jgi:hypothetical protein
VPRLLPVCVISWDVASTARNGCQNNYSKDMPAAGTSIVKSARKLTYTSSLFRPSETHPEEEQRSENVYLF